MTNKTFGGWNGYVEGNSKDSLKFMFSYGVASGPAIVAVHLDKSASLEGKAEIPGGADIMRDISSLCSLCIEVVSHGNKLYECIAV